MQLYAVTMRIGYHGASLDLGIEGYQFPSLEANVMAGNDRDFDANWLVVAGQARTADGTVWRFQDPALDTYEAVELARWLRAVVAETAPPGWLEFTEPNLSFAVESYGESQVRLRVRLEQECAEPPTIKRQWQQSRLTIDTDKRQLEEAVAALEKQLAEFPPR